MDDDMTYDRDETYDRDRDRDLGDRGKENRGKGAMDRLSGKAQESWGKLTGDKGDEIQGKVKQGKGSMEQDLGQAEEDIDSDLA